MNRLPDAAVEESADYCSWELPDSPIQVRISVEAVERMRAEAIRGMGLLSRRGVEIGGVLLGTVVTGDDTSVTVDDVLAVPIEYASGPTYSLSEKDKTNLREVLCRWDRSPGRPIYAVGFYRTQLREGLSLAPEDLQVFAEHFPDPSSVVLLIRPQPAGSCPAALFFRDGDEVTAEPVCLEFPPPRNLAANEVSAHRPAVPGERAAKPPDLDQIPLPSFLGDAAPNAGREPGVVGAAGPAARPQPLWVSWWIQIPVLAGLLFVDGFMGYLAAGQLRPAAMKRQSAAQNPYALSVLVVQYGDNLHLTWNHKAPALASADRATLWIVDGGQSRSLDLSLDQLRNGSVSYRRLSDHVTLRLEVFLGRNRSVSESWNLNETALPRE